MSDHKITQVKDAQSTLNAISQLSELLNTGLAPDALATCVRLCEVGVHPELLARMVKELQVEVENLSRGGSRSNIAKSGSSRSMAFEQIPQ